MKRAVWWILIVSLTCLVVAFYFALRADQLAWEGAKLIRLPNLGRLREPSWSPDGTRIAVVTDDLPPRLQGTIIIVGLDGRQMAGLEARCEYHEPHWSPDGKQLLFNGCDGAEFAPLPNLSPAQKVGGDYAVWSPDGNYLAVLHSGRPGLGIPTTLAIREHSGITVTVPLSITDAGRRFGGLSWTGATNTIVLSYGSSVENPYGGLSRDLYILTPQPAASRRLTQTEPQDEYDPSWSPDGRWIVYIAAADSYPTAIGTITFTRPDGSCTISGYSHGELTGIDWSPMGDKLAVTFRNHLYTVDIFTMLGRAYTDLDALCPTS